MPGLIPGGAMRTMFLPPLLAVVVVVVGCGVEKRPQAAHSLPQRDLTLATQVAPVEIASPVELQQFRPRQQKLLRSRRTLRHEPKVVFAAVMAAPALIGTDTAPVAELTGAASGSSNDRELPPGKTVT